MKISLEDRSLFYSEFIKFFISRRFPHLSEKIEIGALLKIDIPCVREDELNTIQAIANVVWSDLASEERWGEYRYGLQFLSFYKEDLDKLKILLREAGQTYGWAKKQ